VRSFFEWIAQLQDFERPWLMLGKGPSFAERTKYDLGDYHLLSLNHAVREQPVLVAHIIDLDVVQACEEALDQHARVVVMPWYPHVRNAVGERSLADLVPTVPALARLAEAGKLLWYDLSTSARRHGPGPVVRATYFSAEAALNLLATAGVRRVRTLGVDGGATYSADFEDLREGTLLANGHATFDLQFQGFAQTILETGVDIAPLNVPSPARMIVTFAQGEALAARVLAHAIRKHASLSVEVQELGPGEFDEAAWAGGAIILNARVHCLADIRPLWMLRAGQCEPLVVDGMGLVARGALPPSWYLSRRYVPGRTRLLYYPNDGSEPWLSRAHPQGYLWMRDLLDGIRLGIIPLQCVVDEIRRGHVRPSLGCQVEQGLEEPSLLPRSVRALDRGFRGPTGQRVRVMGPVAGAVAAVEALARRARRQVRAYRRTETGELAPTRLGR
jgi:hypothetical protein